MAGRVQSLILEALALGLASGRSDLTTTEIADCVNIAENSILGATSGMVRCGNRHWVREVTTGNQHRSDRRWAITAVGMAEVLKVARKKETT